MQVTVFFNKIKDEIISNLKKAKKEIKVAVAWLTDEDIPYRDPLLASMQSQLCVVAESPARDSAYRAV